MAEEDGAKKRPGHGRGVGHHVFVAMFGVYHAAWALGLLYAIFLLWPALDPDSDTKAWIQTIVLKENPYPLSDDGRLILLVAASGALGSYVHSATSFVSFVGNRRLVWSWAWWYLLRPLIGMALALIFYFVMRGGLLSSGSTSSEISVFGVCAVSGLVGMFSKQAADKLREIADNLFSTKEGGDAARADKLDGNLAVTEAMIPREKIVGHTIPKGGSNGDVLLVKHLHSLLGGVVTRIPIFDVVGAVKYVIHQSILFKYLAAESIKAAKAGQTFGVDDSTLADLLRDEDLRVLVEDAVVCVSAETTLAEAYDRMFATKHCQDVFVTEKGSRSEPVLGWLPNAELARLERK